MGRDMMAAHLEMSLSSKGNEFQDTWLFNTTQVFSMKCVDEQGDTYTVSPLLEVEDGFMLSELNKDLNC